MKTHLSSIKRHFYIVLIKCLILLSQVIKSHEHVGQHMGWMESGMCVRKM